MFGEGGVWRWLFWLMKKNILRYSADVARVWGDERDEGEENVW